MKKILISMVATLVLFGAFLAFSGVATADHSFAMTGFAGRIDLLTACRDGGLVFDADTPFKIAHGWGVAGWSDLSSEEKRGFNHRTTTFVLLIDGVIQKSALHAALDKSMDAKLKIFVSEYHMGLSAGDYDFRIEFYLDGSLNGGDFRDAVLDFDCDIPATAVW